MIISETACSHGYGGDLYKWCSGLTAEERAAVQRGEIVVYVDGKLSNGNSGTYLRQAVHRPGRGYARIVPSEAVIDEYEMLTSTCTRYVPLTAEERKTRRAQARISARNAQREIRELFNKIDASTPLTPREAHQRGIISERQLMTFGIDETERTELIDEPLLRMWQGQAVVCQVAVYHPGGHPILVAPKSEPKDGTLVVGYYQL